MPISKPWSKITDSKLEEVPAKPGVYELKSFGSSRPVYIGQTNNLRERIKRHSQKRNPNKFRYKEAGLLEDPTSMEEAHIARFKEKHGETPKWNEKDPSKGGGGGGAAAVIGGVIGGVILAAIFGDN